MLRSTRNCSYVLVLMLAMHATLASSDGASAALQAEELMGQFHADSMAPGLAVSVGINGTIVWSSGFGFSDREQKVRVDPGQSLFRVGSTIKMLTAYAAMQLVEAGKLDLDAPVQTYVPGFPDKGVPITTRQLLAHLGGIRHYQGMEFLLNEQYDSVTESLTIFQDDELVNPPGEAYFYSSYGYNLISAVIEGASGQPYLEYMQEQVFVPLGMISTVPDQAGKTIAHRGQFYYSNGDEVLIAPAVNNSYKWASGGFLSTTEDLLRFGFAMLASNGLSQQTIGQMWTPQKTSGGEQIEYGLGFRITTDEMGHLWIGHGGGSMGGSTQFWMRPDKGLVIAMVGNMSQIDYGTVLISLSQLFVSD